MREEKWEVSTQLCQGTDMSRCRFGLYPIDQTCEICNSQLAINTCLCTVLCIRFLAISSISSSRHLNRAFHVNCRASRLGRELSGNAPLSAK